jgi:hypothetical protein
MTIQTNIDGEKIAKLSQTNQYSPLKKFLSIIKGIDFVSFVIANLIVLVFFETFLKGGQFWIYVLMFLVSLIVVKTEFVLSAIDIIYTRYLSQKSDMESSQIEDSSNIFLSKKLRFFGIIIIAKQAFFNISYYLFPILLIWLGIGGFLFVTGIQSYTSSTHFFEIVTIVSIALAIFDYFLKRHEEKVAFKINIFVKKITDIINQETSFNNFYRNIGLGKENDEIKKWISHRIDPKLMAQDFISIMSENPESTRSFRHFIKNSKVPLQISVSYPESNKKFEILEATVFDRTPQKKKLIDSYRKFFSDDLLYQKIIDKIEKEFDIKEFGILTMSNINIIHEVSADFITIQVRKGIDEMFAKEHSNPFDQEFERAEEFRNALTQKVWIEIFERIY